MAESHQDLILSTLQELRKEDFKRFKFYLRDEEFLGHRGYSPIPVTHLEDKDCVDIVDRLFRHYTRAGALRVTGIILEKIKENQLAARIWNYLRDIEYMDLK